MKKIIRLTESDLKDIILCSVNNILSEARFNNVLKEDENNDNQNATIQTILSYANDIQGEFYSEFLDSIDDYGCANRVELYYDIDKSNDNHIEIFCEASCDCDLDDYHISVSIDSIDISDEESDVYLNSKDNSEAIRPIAELIEGCLQDAANEWLEDYAYGKSQRDTERWLNAHGGWLD